MELYFVCYKTEKIVIAFELRDTAPAKPLFCIEYTCQFHQTFELVSHHRMKNVFVQNMNISISGIPFISFHFIKQTLSVNGHMYIRVRFHGRKLHKTQSSLFFSKGLRRTTFVIQAMSRWQAMKTLPIWLYFSQTNVEL